MIDSKHFAYNNYHITIQAQPENLSHSLRSKTMKLLIQQGKIFTMDLHDSNNFPLDDFRMTGTIYESGDILIEDKKIQKIANHIPLNSQEDYKVIDAQGCYVFPGIIEAHSHIGITEEKKGQEGDDCNETSSPITPQLRALDAVNPLDAAFHDALKAGITSVMVGPGSSNVIGGQFLFMKTWGSRCIDDLVILHPSALKVAFGENPKTLYGGKDQFPTTRMSIAAILREELFQAKQYQQQKKSAKSNHQSFQEDFRKECYLPVLERKIPLKAHVHRADDILTAIRIAKEFAIDITLDHCSEGHLITDAIKASGFPAIVGPDLASRSKIEVENMAFKTAGILSKAGVTVAITTDHPVSLIQSLPLCAGLAAKNGLGVPSALLAITHNAAKICRVDHWVGSLEVGKDADLAIFDGNPLELFTNCRYTIVNGEIAHQYDKET